MTDEKDSDAAICSKIADALSRLGGTPKEKMQTIVGLEDCAARINDQDKRNTAQSCLMAAKAKITERDRGR